MARTLVVTQAAAAGGWVVGADWRSGLVAALVGTDHTFFTSPKHTEVAATLAHPVTTATLVVVEVADRLIG